MHRTTPEFWRHFDRLPESAQRIARWNFDLLKTNPACPSLHFEKVGGFWSARVGLAYRALAVGDGGDFIWVWIGGHDEYDRIIRR